MDDVLLCFAHAGGGGTAFRSWPRRIAGSVVHPIILPGRESRHAEPFATSLDGFVDDVLDAYGPEVAAGRYSLFGFSLGGSIALAVARAAVARGLPAPRRIVVSGSRPPSVPDPLSPLHRHSDGVLMGKLRNWGGIPESAFADREFMTLVLATLRADLRLVETAEPSTVRLSCPLLVVGGSHDASVPVEILHAWQHETDGPVDIVVIEAGHFLTDATTAEVLELLDSSLGEDDDIERTRERIAHA